MSYKYCCSLLRIENLFRLKVGNFGGKNPENHLEHYTDSEFPENVDY